MFPIPWNKLFRKKDGSIVTIDDAISSGGGGDPYVLPTASADTKGGVKIGSGLAMDGEVLSANAALPAHTAADAGKVLMVDDNGDLAWEEVASEYGVYATLLVGRPAFKPSSTSGKYNIAITNKTVSASSDPGFVFSSDAYTIDEVYIPDSFDNFEFYNDVTAGLITDLGLELIFESLESTTASVTLNDPITDYSALVIQGCYGASGISDYDTTMIYVNPKINTNYWFGMKDRNISYGGFITFTDSTHGTITAPGTSPESRRLKIYGIPKE